LNFAVYAPPANRARPEDMVLFFLSGRLLCLSALPAQKNGHQINIGLVKLVAMQLLPVSLSLKNRKCLVVGTQPQGSIYIQELVTRQAHVVAVASEHTESLPDGVVIEQREFTAEDLDGCWLVIAACSSAVENNAIKQLCDDRQLFCYVVGDETTSSWQPADMTTTPGDPDVISAQPSDSIRHRSVAGLVSLVGAGPGDPELLTIRALKLIQQADAIVYDRLVSKPILALCNKNAEFVYAGKAKANHTLPQHSINALLVELARKHTSVIRLKGGDPFIFGRGGEEIETLVDQQISFEVVPGITAAAGCAAFAGIPLTHRDHAQSCIFVTGHLRDGKINLNWKELTDPQQTIVVYMGLTGIDLICETLIQYGRSGQTPAALIEQGTKPEQRVLSATLSDLPTLVAQSNVAAPTLLIIGGVVTLRDKLEWFMPTKL